jgi:hypothetical protein
MKMLSISIAESLWTQVSLSMLGVIEKLCKVNKKLCTLIAAINFKQIYVKITHDNNSFS